MVDERRLRQWVAQRWRVIFTVCGALLAAILGAAVQEILDTRLRLAAAAVLVVCLLAITLLAGLTVVLDSRLKADGEIIATVRDQTGKQNLIAEASASQISLLGLEIGKLAHSIGMRVDTMLMSELNSAKSIEADRTVQLMLSAKEEIRILDLLLNNGHWPDEAMDQSYQMNAFEAFRALLERSVPSISYKRIIQVLNPDSSLLRAFTPNLVKHCYNVLELQRTKGSKVSLRVTRQRFPFKFILIDQTAIVLQLQEYGIDSDDFKIWGEVLINDPSGQLIAVFRGIWDELMDDPSTRTVTFADLPQLDAPSEG